jgi:hypothetical protein
MGVGFAGILAPSGLNLPQEQITFFHSVTVEKMIATCARYSADLGRDENWIVGFACVSWLDSIGSVAA